MSWDTVLGGPFNIAQYAFLQHLLARATNTKPRYLKINYGDAHIYTNHIEILESEVLPNKPIPCGTELAIMTDNNDIDGYTIEDFQILNYDYGRFVKFPIAV
jgi:thymidylate synthase